MAFLHTESLYKRAAVAPFSVAVMVVSGLTGAKAQGQAVIRTPSASLRTQGAVRNQASPTSAKRVVTLREALDLTVWNVAQKGPLITFDPDRVFAGGRYQNTGGGGSDSQRGVMRLGGSDGGPGGGTGTLPLPGRAGYGLNVVATHFARRVVRLDTVSVVAPDKMVVLRAPTKKMDPFATLSSPDKLKMLMASLSKQQWQRLCGEQGLSAGDLPGEQRALMLSLLPDPFTVMPVKPGDFGGYSYSRTGNEPDRRVDFTGASRAGIRLRLNMTAQMTLPSLDNKRPTLVIVNSRVPNTEFYTAASFSPRPVASAATAAEVLKETLPNRLKQGQINFAAPTLDARIALKGVKTLNDLVRRVAAATRLEIFADHRVAILPVWIRGEERSARSGDVLQALCWGTTGAFRKVGTAYILTDDVEGIGARRLRIEEATREKNALLRDWQQKMDERIRKTNAVEFLTFQSNDVLKPDDTTIATLKEKWRTFRGRYEGVEVPVEKLNSTQKERVKEAIARSQEMLTRYTFYGPVATDRVRINTTPRITYVVPGIGNVDANNLGYVDLNIFLPVPTEVDEGMPGTPAPPKGPVQLPVQPIGGVLVVAPTTPEQATLFVQTARDRQFRQVWVSMTPGKGGDTSILAAAVAAGKSAGVPVSALVRLMIAPSDLEPSYLDRNILGETNAQWAERMRLAPVGMFPNQSANRVPAEDWLFPDTATVMARLKPRLREIAAVPGISGIVFRDAAAPGYGLPDSGYFYTGNLSEYGYTEEMRLALIRRVGCDPLDVVGDTQYGNYQYALPYFPDAPQMRVTTPSAAGARETTTPKMAWNALRFERNAQLLGQVYGFMKAEFPKLNLMLRDLTSSPYSGWYGSWEKADGLPRATIYPSESGRSAWIRSLRAKTPRVALYMAPMRDWLMGVGAKDGEEPTPEVVTTTTARLQAYLARENAWDGYVFDFSTLPAETTLLLMKNMFATAAVPVPPTKSAEQSPRP